MDSASATCSSLNLFNCTVLRLIKSCHRRGTLHDCFFVSRRDPQMPKPPRWFGLVWEMGPGPQVHVVGK